jgi:hypothetical protein
MKKMCMCGEKLTELNSETSYCRSCSSRYNSEGALLVSRHNWNVNEFFSLTPQKSQTNQNKKHQHLDQL